MTALAALLSGIVDYAGLFPPASLDMPAAVREYASYLREPDAWMLGRFVVPVARMHELVAAVDDAHVDAPWRIAALLGADPEADLRTVRSVNGDHASRLCIDVVEVKLDSTDGIARVASNARDLTVFVETPVAADVEALIGVIREQRVFAKIRTGGVTSDAIPSPAAVVQFMRACINAGVAFKATAGLHHPIRATHRLTYAADAPRAVMFGYLNVFVAAALMANGLSDRDAIRLLDERHADAFSFDEETISWRGHSVGAADVRRVRADVAIAFGSCSFREPVDELKALTHAA